MWKGEKVKMWDKCKKPNPFLGALFNAHPNLTYFARLNENR